MKQNIREQFKKRFDGYWRGEAISDEIIFWWIDKLNTTLKEIENGSENVELNLEAGNKDHENFAKGVDYMKEKVKKLIHQKLIK